MENIKIEPIITEIGIISGRDAIYLNDLTMLNEMTFRLSGKIIRAVERKYTITFKKVHLFKIVELDFDEIECQSSFDKVVNSVQLDKMIEVDKQESIGKIDNSFRHYVFRTYDSVFEIICKEFDLQLK